MVILEYVGKHREQGLYEVKGELVRDLLLSGEWADPGVKKKEVFKLKVKELK